MSIIGTIKGNLGTIGIGAGGAALGFGLGLLASRKKTYSKSRKRKKLKSSTVRKRYRVHHKQKKPYTAGKRKDTSHRRIRYTKNNQPYVILASGKARFIKKKSVRSSRKRTGGRY